MRRMSCAMTKEAVIARQKTVTRRKGWTMAKVGDRLHLVTKTMGLKKGETADTLGYVEIVDIRREPLSELTADDVEREGYPGMRPDEFIRRFFEPQGIRPSDFVTRIEWRYIEAP